MAVLNFRSSALAITEGAEWRNYLARYWIIPLAIILCILVRIYTRRKSQQAPPQLPNRSLGLPGQPIVRNARRYHSITVLTETAPLLMEAGQDFFPPPSVRRPRKQTQPRRNLTSPMNMNSLMQTLHSAHANDSNKPSNLSVSSAGTCYDTVIPKN
ncbi:hypothetical protein BX667DRAFT_497261 [Coemansia mojavensis]|nr:hypothetical protein BX667DRAFT_497261 [Coemansia mojavensis]